MDADGNSIDSNRQPQRRNTDGYWNAEDERYYGQNGRAGDSRSFDSGGGGSGGGGGGGGRWHYPANFEDSVPPDMDAPSGKKKKKKDRWARTEDAYALPDGELVEGGGRRKTKKKKRKTKNHSTVGGADDGDSFDRRSGSTTDFPEDAEGGLYGSRTNGYGNGNGDAPREPVGGRQQEQDELNHQF